MKHETAPPARGFINALLIVFFTGLLLYIGRDILIPLSFAALIACVLYPVCAWLERRGMHRGTAISLAMLFLFLIGALIVTLLFTQIIQFTDEWPVLRQKVTESFTSLQSTLVAKGISLEQQEHWITRIADQSGGSVWEWFSGLVSMSVFSALMLVLIPVYAVLILYHRQYWLNIVYRIFPHERPEELKNMIHGTVNAYYNFIKGMGIVYLIVGILNSLGLLVLGIPHAILFGMVAAILTFIPYVGIMVGSLLPMTIAWITYDSIWYPVGIMGIFALVQYLEANLIFPLAVSYRLNINTLVMLLSIFVGGLLWGMAGMILFVPFVGIAKMIADHNPKWKTVSMILGTGK